MAKRRRKDNGHLAQPWVDDQPGPICGKLRRYRCGKCGRELVKVIPPCRGAPGSIPCGMPMTISEPRSYCTGTMEVVE